MYVLDGPINYAMRVGATGQMGRPGRALAAFSVQQRKAPHGAGVRRPNASLQGRPMRRSPGGQSGYREKPGYISPGPIAPGRGYRPAEKKKNPPPGFFGAGADCRREYPRRPARWSLLAARTCPSKRGHRERRSL